MKMEQTECSETSAYKIQTPGNYPEENIQHILASLRVIEVRNVHSDAGSTQVLGLSRIMCICFDTHTVPTEEALCLPLK